MEEAGRSIPSRDRIENTGNQNSSSKPVAHSSKTYSASRCSREVRFRELAQYHPVVVEGPGRHDDRDPNLVAKNVCAQLHHHWSNRSTPLTKPRLVVIQGDPLRKSGISAVTRKVASLLGVSRGLTYLDQGVDASHSSNADRENVIIEFQYADLVCELDRNQPSLVQTIKEAVKKYLKKGNAARRLAGRPPLADYIHRFSLLQEVTKATCLHVCGDITVAHTRRKVSDFSVTGFYKVGLELNVIDKSKYVVYRSDDDEDSGSSD